MAATLSSAWGQGGARLDAEAELDVRRPVMVNIAAGSAASDRHNTRAIYRAGWGSEDPAVMVVREETATKNRKGAVQGLHERHFSQGKTGETKSHGQSSPGPGRSVRDATVAKGYYGSETSHSGLHKRRDC